ncbi:MAG: HIT family protein [Lachnospiraceae bacterium]
MCKENCIFCKIVNGDIPSRTIYQDDLFRVILDISPATKGHALIIPKKHYDDLYDLGETEAKAIFPLAQKLVKKMTEILHCDGFNVMQNNGEVSGQTVFHFHVHLIPRYENDKNREKLLWNHEDFSQEELDTVLEALR